VPVISAVSFTGNTATPTVIVSGQGFGTSPGGQLDNATSCGSYANNGDDFGTNNLWFQDNGNFAADGHPAHRQLYRHNRPVLV
jgi:hypothetical protein